MTSELIKTADSVNILDIRTGDYITPGKPLREEVLRGLTGDLTTETVVEDGLPIVRWNKRLPTVVLYDGQGIKLFENITQDPDYYIFHEEVAILAAHGLSIITSITNPLASKDETYAARGSKPDCLHLTLVDLGAGPLKKAETLLKTIEKESSELLNKVGYLEMTTTYCAVDIQYQELQDRLCDLLQNNPTFIGESQKNRDVHRKSKIVVRGVCGSYIDSLKGLRDNEPGLTTARPESNADSQKTHCKCLMWLGSSITNMEPSEAVAFLRNLSTSIHPTQDTILVGVDHCRDIQKMKTAYGENSHRWKAYARNGVKAAGSILGPEALLLVTGASRWEFTTRWDADKERHVRFVRPHERISFNALPNSSLNSKPVVVNVEKGEHIFLAQSYKYSISDIELIFHQANLKIVQRWTDNSDCSLYLLRCA